VLCACGFEPASRHCVSWFVRFSAKPVFTLENPRDALALAKPLKSVIAAKQFGFEDFLAPLVAQACVTVMPDGRNAVNVDNVRVSKLIGRTIYDSQVVKGSVVERDSLGSVKHVTDAKIAIFGCGIEAGSTETKGNVVLKNAADLKSFTQGEEKAMEDAIAAIAATGANVVIASGAISEIAMHYLEKYRLMVLKIISKFELRRVCRAVGATALSRLGAPTADELGSAASVSVQELSSARVTVFSQTEDEDTGIATIVLRGPTKQILDDVERAINDAVNVAKALCRDGRCVAGAGASEIELALALQAMGDECPGLEQYAIKKVSVGVHHSHAVALLLHLIPFVGEHGSWSDLPTCLLPRLTCVSVFVRCAVRRGLGGCGSYIGRDFWSNP